MQGAPIGKYVEPRNKDQNTKVGQGHNYSSMILDIWHVKYTKITAVVNCAAYKLPQIECHIWYS